MKLGIDARMINWSGIGRYTETLLSGLREFGSNIAPVLFCNEGAKQATLSQASFEMHFINTPVFALNAARRLAQKLKSYSIDLYHSPHFVIPSGKIDYPIIITIHDLIPLIVKETMPNPLHRYYYYSANKFACRSAARIIVPSNSTKNDLVRMLGIPEEKIDIVYNGQEQKFKRASKKAIEQVKTKFLINDKYLFALGNQKPNKGIEYLIDAFSIFCRQRTDYKLVLTGKLSNKFKAVSQRIASYELESKVKFTGNVTDDELAALYSGASAFVFPSLYEGFGFPPLEAMACEVPVVASTRSSVPEVVGEAALTIDPVDIQALANALLRVVDDNNFRATLIDRGLKRLDAFSLEKFTEETMAVYSKPHTLEPHLFRWHPETTSS